MYLNDDKGLTWTLLPANLTLTWDVFKCTIWNAIKTVFSNLTLTWDVFKSSLYDGALQR